MPSPSLIKIIEVIDTTFCSASVVLNLLLLYLIFCRTSIRLQPYQPILLQTCLIDLFFAIVNGTFKVHIESKDGYFYAMLGSGFDFIRPPWNEFVCFVWVFGLFYSLTAIPVCFVYRYILIVNKQRFSTWQYVALIFPSFLAAFIYAAYGMWVFWHDPIDHARAASLLRADAFYRGRMPNFIAAHISGWPLKVLFAYCYVLVSIAYIVTLVANYKVWVYLKGVQTNMTKHVHDLQRQITLTLVIQAAIPTLVCACPVGFAVTTSIFKLNIPGLVLALSFIWCWLPIANPLITIVIINCYRRHVIGLVKTILQKKSTYFSTSGAEDAIQQTTKVASTNLSYGVL